MEERKIRVLIVDDDELIVMSLEMIVGSNPEFEVIGKGYGGQEAIKLYDELKPDILMMDIRMPDLNGTEAAGKILEKHPDAKILFLTTFSDEEYIVKALSLGIKGYLLKQDYKSVPQSLQSVMSGQIVFGGDVVEKLPTIMSKAATNETSSKDQPSDGSKSVLSEDKVNFLKERDINDKEYELIQLVAKGYTNKEISETIFLSEGTVKNYISNILDKLELRDRTALAIWYLS
jgi:DNA-binding NarL/FixJ family response regulator